MRFRWLVIVAWLAATVAGVTLLPDIKSAHTGSLGDLVATDVQAVDTELRSIDLFHLEGGVDPFDAAEVTTADLLPTIVTAALSVAAASAVLVVAQLGFFRAVGPGAALAVLVALAVVTTLVPALLAVIGPRILWPGARRAGGGRTRSPRRLRAAAPAHSACPRSIRC